MEFLLVILLYILIVATQAGEYQRKLLDKLFKNYDPNERPVLDDIDTLNVSVGLAIQQIVDVDEKKQTIVFSGWLDMTWTDYNLQWDPAEYGNITTIRIQSSKIWIPDLLLYNSADDTFDVTAKINAVLSYTGEVNYLPPGMFKSTCPILIDDFPFDEQNCSLKFGSWTHDEATINLTNKSSRAQLDSYIKNGEWYLEDVTSYSKSISYECCPTKFPFVMFVIHIRRRTLYFIINLIFPCLLISFMSILGFSLPPDSGEKIGLEITTLLSIIMFSQIITGIIPESSLSIPKIGIYFASVMIISALSIIANVAVLIFHHRNVKIQQPIPRIIDLVICRFLAKILRMKRPNEEKKSKNKSYNLESELNDNCSKSLLANVLDINDDFGVVGGKSNSLINRNINSRFYLKQQNSNSSNNNNVYLTNNQVGLKRDNSNMSSSGADNFLYESSSINNKADINTVRKNLGAILKEIRVITQKLKDDEEDETKSLNWKFAAMVIDRLCLVVFSIATVLSTVLILFTSKNIFKPSDPHKIF
ncbi:unnamed protein product [Brachionus calyciflorus]|uniref:Uncharacterized protein n=1 Tax=Brachionus calyciflorus TaxID=104777 RepID=A0A813LZL9_9BILA|nr:unnamed protein product [Brachionus calyciflorus]